MNEKDLAFKQWVLSRTSDQYEIEDQDRKVVLTAEYARAFICFNELGIIEFQIINSASEETEFYLHFQLNDESHAKNLFDQLIECLLNIRPQSKMKVLLSCSSALTTSYFTQKLNQTAELINAPYEFHAVSCNLLKEKAEDFKIILLAPQIAFKKKEISDYFPDKTVVEIPGRMFGTYDVRGIIELVRENSAKASGSEEKKLILQSSRKIMAITTRLDSTFKISYRIYYRGKICRSETVIKDRMDIHDFEDILDTISILEKDIDTVVISMPGIVKHGSVTLPNFGFEGFDMRKYLSEKYPYTFVITNNANATALGLYHMQNDYSSIVYHSQLSIGNRGGQGVVVNGNVITGKNGIAGEINCLLDETKDEGNSPEEAARTCANAILSDIAVIGPYAVYIRCNMIHDVRKIREIILQRVEEQYIPELVLIPHSTEYMYYGAQMLANNKNG